MQSVIKRAILNSVCTAVYIVLIVSLIFSMQTFQDKPDNILIPMAMLMLFVCSAAVTSFLVFGKPVMLYIDGRKKEAVSMLSYTIAALFVLTLLFFAILIIYLQ